VKHTCIDYHVSTAKLFNLPYFIPYSYFLMQKITCILNKAHRQFLNRKARITIIITHGTIACKVHGMQKQPSCIKKHGQVK